MLSHVRPQIFVRRADVDDVVIVPVGQPEHFGYVVGQLLKAFRGLALGLRGQLALGNILDGADFTKPAGVSARLPLTNFVYPDC